MPKYSPERHAPYAGRQSCSYSDNDEPTYTVRYAYARILCSTTMVFVPSQNCDPPRQRPMVLEMSTLKVLIILSKIRLSPTTSHNAVRK